MDNQKSILKSIKNIDKENFGSSFYKKLKLFAWETGLGPVINVRPDVLGQQAVFYFPGRSGKLSCPCFEKNGKILLALTEKELESIRDLLLQNPGIELWMRNGWFSGTARLLSDEEKNEIAETVSDEQFFGHMLRNFIKPSLKNHYLLEAERHAPCTGTEGPGSKAWIWAAAALALLFSRKRK